MMLRPSYSDLLEVVNKDCDETEQIGSRYTIVIAAAKRAREIIDEYNNHIAKNEPIISGSADKPVSTAVEELYEGKIKIVQNDEI